MARNRCVSWGALLPQILERTARNLDQRLGRIDSRRAHLRAPVVIRRGRSLADAKLSRKGEKYVRGAEHVDISNTVLLC